VRLSCQKSFLFAAALTLGCHESTAPPGAIEGAYLLEAIDGRALPANIVARQGDTITVLWSTLNLDGVGNAVLVERLRIVHPNAPAFQQTQTTGYTYSVTGDMPFGHDVTFVYSPPCPPNALCVEPPTARVLGSTLILSYGEFSYSRPPSFYRRGAFNQPN
jgi:hypothetical protein